MPDTSLIPSPTRPNLKPIIRGVVNSVKSVHTKTAYERALLHFFSWYIRSNKPRLTWSTLQDYVTYMQTGPDKITDSSVNLRLSAIRKMLEVAHKEGAIDAAEFASIKMVKGLSLKGVRSGNWLTLNQAQQLINAPDIARVKGKRDRAILSVLIDCGLRRDECANLTLDHIQQREDRWVIIDLLGKGNKTRTVTISEWCKAAIDAWLDATLISSGYLFRPLNKKGGIVGDKLSDQTIYDILKYYCIKTGLDVAPHDLRRTFAKLARKGGAQLEQIQLALGHTSIRTTQRYLGTEQDLVHGPGDVIDIKIE